MKEYAKEILEKELKQLKVTLGWKGKRLDESLEDIHKLNGYIEELKKEKVATLNKIEDIEYELNRNHHKLIEGLEDE